MADTVTVKAEVDYACWDTPDTIGIVVESPVEEGSFTVETPLEAASPEVIDALAAKWLDHLYGRLNRPSPFTKSTPKDPSNV